LVTVKRISIHLPLYRNIGQLATVLLGQLGDRGEEICSAGQRFPQKQQLVSALGDDCPAVIGHSKGSVFIFGDFL
jgi:hypothetical protein